MEGLLSELDYFEPYVMQLRVMGDYDRVFGTGQTLVQGGPIDFMVRGADEVSLDLNNSKLEIKLKTTLENENDFTGGTVWGLLMITSMHYSCQWKWNWEGCLSPTRKQNIHIEPSSKI